MLFDSTAKVTELTETSHWVDFTHLFIAMNKHELAEQLSNQTNTSHAAALRSIDALVNIVTSTVAGGDEVTLIGFGSFKPNARAARVGMNPKTTEAIKIPATTVPQFSPGKRFKDAVSS